MSWDFVCCFDVFCVFVCQDPAHPEGAPHPAAQGASSLSAGGWPDWVWCAELPSAFWGAVHAEKCQVSTIASCILIFPHEQEHSFCAVPSLQ